MRNLKKNDMIYPDQRKMYRFLVVKEHRLSALAIVVLGLGMALTGLLPSFSGLIFTTLIMSFGFHYFDTTCDSLTLQHFGELYHQPYCRGCPPGNRRYSVDD
jgi:hypothetical protein